MSCDGSCTSYIKYTTEKERLDKLAFTSFPEDYLPYTSVQNGGRAPYLVWEERGPKRRKGCCRTTALVSAIILIATAILTVVAISVYLGVVTNLFRSPVLSLSGRLRVPEEEFTDNLHNTTSHQFLMKAEAYQHIVENIFLQSSLESAYIASRIYAFGPGLLVFFRVYLDRRKLKQDESGTLEIIKDLMSAPPFEKGSLEIKENDEFLPPLGAFDYHSLKTSPAPSSSVKPVTEAVTPNATVFQSDPTRGQTEKSGVGYGLWKPVPIDDSVSPVIGDARTPPARGSVRLSPDPATVGTHLSVSNSKPVGVGSVRVLENPLSHTDKISRPLPDLLRPSPDLQRPPPDLQRPPPGDVASSITSSVSLVVNRGNRTLDVSRLRLKPASSSDRKGSSRILEDPKPSDEHLSEKQRETNLSNNEKSDQVRASNLNDDHRNETDKSKPVVKYNESSIDYLDKGKDVSSAEKSVTLNDKDSVVTVNLVDNSDVNTSGVSTLSTMTSNTEATATARSVTESGDGKVKNTQSKGNEDKTIAMSAHPQLENSTLSLAEERTADDYEDAMDGIGTESEDSSEVSNADMEEMESSTSSSALFHSTHLKPSSVDSQEVSHNESSDGNESTDGNESSDAKKSSDAGEQTETLMTNSSLSKTSFDYETPSHRTISGKDTTLDETQSDEASNQTSEVPLYKEDSHGSFTTVAYATVPEYDFNDTVPMSGAKVVPQFPDLGFDSNNIESISDENFLDSKDMFPESFLNSTHEDESDWESKNTVCSEEEMRCVSGECVEASARCNMRRDCADNSDEKNCSCSDLLSLIGQSQKICDGVQDCQDFTDELNCPWCLEDQVVCPMAKFCINQSQMCDGHHDCPLGTDERHCVKLAQSTEDAQGLHYRGEGYLMIRKSGEWGKMCLDNLKDSQSLRNKLEELGDAVCSALTYRTVVESKRFQDPINSTEDYFVISNEVSSHDKRSSAIFETSLCESKEVMKVTCNSLDCGLRPMSSSNRRRIVGGASSSSGSWPWQVALYKEGDFQCGAVLVSDSWLVSAGHCFFSSLNGYWVARLGVLRRGTELSSPSEQIRRIDRIILHPEYEDKGFINDIALLRLDRPVLFSDYLRPVCLPTLEEDVSLWHGKQCSVVGWGKLYEIGHTFPDSLQEVRLPVISTEECRKRIIFLTMYHITDNMFCAGYSRGGRDACLGDSGGPLMCQRDDGRWILTGVTSNGDGCGRPGRPGVYTKVANYLGWIHQVIDSEYTPLPFQDGCEGVRCRLGRCTPPKRVCDHQWDCFEGADEDNCTSTN